MEQQAQQTSFMMNSNAKWLVPIIAGFVGFCLCCGVMYAANYVILLSLTGGNLPTDLQGGFNVGAELGQDYPLYGLFSWATLCLPCLTLIGLGVGGYFFVNSYQKRNAGPPPVVTQ